VIRAKAYWSDWAASYEREVNSAEDAMLLLQEIQRSLRVPTMVEFAEQGSGRSCAIGLGREFTVITYQHSLDPPYFISRGNNGAIGQVWFCYGQERTEYTSRNVVSLLSGWSIVRSFFDAPGRPDGIEWEML
jgi:hypothetical protein